MYFDHNPRSKSRTKHTGKENRLFDCVAVISTNNSVRGSFCPQNATPCVRSLSPIHVNTQGHIDEAKENGNEACFFGIQVAY